MLPFVALAFLATALFSLGLDLTTKQIIEPLRDRIIGTVLEEIPDARLTGHAQARLPGHASFVFKDVDGNALLQLLDAAGFACSSGSACKTGSPKPSEVLLAIGLPHEWAMGSLRVTLGVQTTAQQVEAFLKVLPGLVARKQGTIVNIASSASLQGYLGQGAYVTSKHALLGFARSLALAAAV